MKIERFEAGLVMSNTYLAYCEDTLEGMIVDPAAGTKAALRRAEEKEVKIKYIVATHTHPDHISGGAHAKEKTGGEIVAHSSTVGKRNFMRKLESGFGLFYRPSRPDRLVDDGDALEVGNLRFEVLHTPGHTEDGICLAGEGCVITGDTLFEDSVGRTDLPGGSTKRLLLSIREKLMALPDDTVIYPGHGPETTIGRERADNPFCFEALRMKE